MVRLFSGKAGQAIVKVSPRSASRASATGPMLPRSVESKVEQYLKKYWRAPAACSRSSAARDIATASAAGTVRDFNATTMASAAGSGSPTGGTPITCTVRMPWRTSVLARSVAPVRSSAMQPRSSATAGLLPRRRQAGDRVGAELHAAGAAQLLAGLLEPGRIGGRRLEAVLIQQMQRHRRLAEAADLHALLAAGKIGEPQHRAFRVAIGETG